MYILYTPTTYLGMLKFLENLKVCYGVKYFGHFLENQTFYDFYVYRGVRVSFTYSLQRLLVFKTFQSG